jgi:hypothetical protein
MTLRSLPFVSIDAAASTGPGAAKDLEGVGSDFGVMVFATGTPSTVTVQLQGSHDNVNWFTVPTPTITAADTYTNFPNFLCRYVRANLFALSGGSSPTVTVTIAAIG